MATPLFQAIDCVVVRVPDLESALRFYRDKLGHEVIWRSADAIGFRLPDSGAELVAHTRTGPETDLLVADTDAAYARLLAAGARPLTPPFDIAIGRCAVVEDPFGNVLTILDQSKGALVTDADANVAGVRKPG